MNVVQFQQSKQPIRCDGRLCMTTTYYFDNKTSGNRIVFRKWLDNGSCDLRALRGEVYLFMSTWTAEDARGVDFTALAMTLADNIFS